MNPIIDAVNKMIDKACDDKTIEKMRRIIENQNGVIQIDEMRTRLFGAKMYVDIEIQADGNLTLKEAHEIAEAEHD
ncbi:MAG: hypothetical protein KIC96_07035, partial [Enterococcus casseliflavus]|nr:hypothetical protein [Enterococcus casseliflavus]